MSSRRKARSSHSMYHPGISLSHGISYNQRKGMILTRDTNLPHAPIQVNTYQSLQREAKKVLDQGRVGSSQIHIDYDVPLDTSNTIDFADPVLAKDVAEKLGMNKTVYAFWITSFSVINEFAQPWPDISYVLTIGDSSTFTVTCSSSTGTTGLNLLYGADFDTPVVYPLYETGANVSFPRFFRATGWNNYGEVHDVTNPSPSQGTLAIVRGAYNKGYSCIPYLNRGGPYPYSTSTSITIDTTGLDKQITLRLYINVLYYK